LRIEGNGAQGHIGKVDLGESSGGTAWAMPSTNLLFVRLVPKIENGLVVFERKPVPNGPQIQKRPPRMQLTAAGEAGGALASHHQFHREKGL
jgi:hypothetical protein